MVQTLTVSGTTNYTTGASPKAIAPNLSITDPNNGNLNGASVIITSNFNATEDRLSVADQTGTSGTIQGLNWNYNTTTGVLTITGAASNEAVSSRPRCGRQEGRSHRAPIQHATCVLRRPTSGAVAGVPRGRTLALAVSARPRGATQAAADCQSPLLLQRPQKHKAWMVKDAPLCALAGCSARTTTTSPKTNRP